MSLQAEYGKTVTKKDLEKEQQTLGFGYGYDSLNEPKALQGIKIRSSYTLGPL